MRSAAFRRWALSFEKAFLIGLKSELQGRQEQQPCVGRLDHLAHPRAFVTGQIVHGHDVARPEFGHEHFVDIGLEGDAVDRSVEHEGRGDAVAMQFGDEGGRLPVPMRDADPEPLAAQAASVTARHVGRCPGFVDEDEPLGGRERAGRRTRPAAA